MQHDDSARASTGCTRARLTHCHSPRWLTCIATFAIIWSFIMIMRTLLAQRRLPS
jgi:hypothetical protein